MSVMIHSARAARKLACPTVALARNLLPLCLLLPLAGCGTTERMAVSSIPQDDYRVRHPIALAERPRTLEILVEPETGRFDRHSAAQLREFAGFMPNSAAGPSPSCRRRGPVAHLPSNRSATHFFARGRADAPLWPPIRRVPIIVAPVRLSFVGLKASVVDQCGQWPRDLAIGSGAPEDWSNKPYWNFGCAYQSAFAAQVADPRDLVAPQGETPTDTAMRTRAIESLRSGQDPGTNWKLVNSSISTVGAY